MSLITVKRRDELEELANIADKARKLKKEIENILYTLKSVYGRNAHLRVFVEELVKEYKPPTFEGEEVRLASGCLIEYVSSLKEILKDLTVKAGNLEYLYNVIDKVEDNARKLELWAELVKEVSDYRFHEAARVLEKFNRLFSRHVSLEELVSDIAVLNDEIMYCIRKCKSAYLKRVREVREELASGFKILEKARNMASIEETSRVDYIAEKFREFKVLLDRAEREAPNFKIDLNSIVKEVEEFIEDLKVIASRDLTEQELAILKEASRILSAFSSRSVKYDSFVETLSRNCGYNISEVQMILYMLSKKNILKLSVRVE